MVDHVTHENMDTASMQDSGMILLLFVPTNQKLTGENLEQTIKGAKGLKNKTT